MRRAVLAMTLALSTSAIAQGNASVLAGMVVDATTQDPIADAVVVARSPTLAGEQSVVTDGSGAFEITLLSPGTYSLAVKRDGFQPYSPDGLLLKAGRTRVRIAVLPVPVPVRVPAPEPIAESAVEFNQGMTAPTMISGPAPEYTPEAIERGVEGNMQVRCVVTTEGQVRGCKVMKGLAFMNGAVVDALQKRKYKPAVAQGKAIDVYYNFNIRLKLPSQ
jgi:TonB family protein